MVSDYNEKKKHTHLTIKPVDISVRSIIHGNRCIRLYWKMAIETAKSIVQRASKYITVEPPRDHPKCKD